MSIPSLLAKIGVIKILPNIQENCCVGVTPNWLIWLSQVHPLPQACCKIFITHGQASYCQLVATQHVEPSHLAHVRGCWSTEQDHPGSVNKDYWKKTWSWSRVRTQIKFKFDTNCCRCRKSFRCGIFFPDPKDPDTRNHKLQPVGALVVFNASWPASECPGGDISRYNQFCDSIVSRLLLACRCCNNVL